MPTIIDAACPAPGDGAWWRTCPACDQLAAMPPDALFCDSCATKPDPRREGWWPR
jgi:hypothetical protein